MAFSVVPSRETVDCLNVDTGSASTFTAGGTTWYEAAPCKIGSGASAVTMTQADWLLTLENYAKNSSDYIIWYGDRTAAVRGNASTRFTFGTKQYTIGQIKYASVARQGDETTVIAYTFTSTAIQLSYRKSVPSKADMVCSSAYDRYGRMTSKTDSKGASTSYTYDAYGNCTAETTTASGKSIKKTYSYGTASGGGGSGDTTVAYVRSLAQGLRIKQEEGKIALFDLHERPFASKRREDIIGIRPAEDGIGIKLPIALVLVANGSKVFLRGILRISLPHVDDDADLGTF